MSLQLARGAEVRPERPANGPDTMACDMIPYHHPAPTLRVEGYDILDRLGTGGMGVVYKARHRQLNRIVALKMLGRDSHADRESHQRFQAEAQAVARLQHPNIIQVFDVGTFREMPGDPRSRPFLSLEYVDGGSLYKQTLSPQDPRHVAQLLEKVARAVHAAHQVGVVHRDLKPANVLLTGEGEPKIADFGLAKQIDHRRDETGGFLTQDGTAVGTPEYMAPEQVDGLPATPAFDIYSVGVMLYELLTGRQPFKGVTVTETMLLVKYQEPIAPSRLRPSLPKDLETICLKCMAKSPSARYATAEALADDLARWLKGQPIHARPVSRVERLGRWAKRNPSLAIISALALALAVCGVAGIAWKWREAEWNARLAEGRATELEERRQGEQWELYRGCLAFATADLRLNTLTSTRQTLLRAPDQYRGWEWHYYSGQLDVSRQVYTVPVEQVYSPLVPPGRRICLSIPGGIWVWDAVERKLLNTLMDPEYYGATPDGRSYLRRLDARAFVIRPLVGEGAEVRIEENDDVLEIAYSADCRRLLLTTRHSAQVWDTQTGKPVGKRHTTLTPPGGGPGTTALSADGTLAANHYPVSGDLEIWEVETGRVRVTVRGLEDLFAVKFNRDGSRVYANAAFPSSRLKVWDSQTGKLTAVMEGHTNNITDQVYSPDGTRVATSSVDQSVRVWDAGSGKLLFILRGHTSRVNAVAFSPDGTRLVSASDDRTLRLWDVATGQELGVLRGHTDTVTGATFVDADTVASTALDRTVRYWDARPGTGSGLWTGHTGFVYAAVCHPDGRVLSGGWDGFIRVWGEGGRQVRKFETPEHERVCGLAVDPAGKWVAAICWGDRVHLWDYATGKVLHSWDARLNHWKTGRVAFHPSLDLLASCGGHKTVEVVSPVTHELVATLDTQADAVRDVAFSPDGKWLAAAGDGDKTVHVWEVATWKKVQTLTGATDAYYSLAFSPDGNTLVAGSMDGNAYVWRTGTWEKLATLPHGAKVYGLAFTPDGKRLACGCADNTVRLWDTARHEQVAELRGHTDYIHSLTFDRDGRRLVTASGDLTLRTWDAPKK